jgi:hypothetical protein
METGIMATMLKLLEKQLGLWELRRRLEDVGQRPGRCLAGSVAYGPCLLLSRERGSGGGGVARLVGERLGWHVFDREVLDEIAQLAHVRQQVVESVEDEPCSDREKAWRPELEPEDIGYEHYLRHLRQVVLTLGHHGDVVILGRGAQYLLPAQSALRVRIVAPLELRVRRLAERDHVPLLEAEAHVLKFDAGRSEFIRKCFQRDPNSPLDYDLIVNTGEIRPEAAAELVILALRDKLDVRPQKA